MTEKKVVEAREPRRERAGVVWPILLIAAGVLFLLDNLNVINFDFWYAAARLWPVVLIAIGLDMLVGRRSLVLSAMVAIFAVIVLVAGFFWLGVGGGDGDPISENINQPLSGAEAAMVDVSFGVGELTLGALPAGAGELITGVVNRPNDRMRIEQSFDMEEDIASYSLEMRGSSGPDAFMNMSGDDWRWDLQLNRDVPMELIISTGVGEANLDLRNLNLTVLDIDTGVGETTVTLPGTGELLATVDGGIGELTIEIPEGTAARITSDTGLGQTNIPSAFERDGDVYTSGGYDDALDRIDLQISAGIGQVNVRTYSGR